MSIATRSGDDGTTALMYGRRVEKSDPRIEALGAIDELNSAIGLARAQALESTGQELMTIQKELVKLMGEVSVIPEDEKRYQNDKMPRMADSALEHLDRLVLQLEAGKLPYDGWATPGANMAAATLDVARTICRRAERRVVDLESEADLPMQYLNRLSDVLWLMAREAEGKSRKV